jgi:hypothetical protein
VLASVREGLVLLDFTKQTQDHESVYIQQNQLTYRMEYRTAVMLLQCLVTGKANIGRVIEV